MQVIENLWIPIYKEHMRVILPLIMIIWIFSMACAVFYFWFILDLPFVFILTARTFQLAIFFSDRNLCLIVGYYPLQEYFHNKFERETRWFHFKFKILYWFGFHPYYRCRCKVLKTWYHSYNLEINQTSNLGKMR